MATHCSIWGRGATPWLRSCRSLTVFSAMVSCFSSACSDPGNGGSGQPTCAPQEGQEGVLVENIYLAMRTNLRTDYIIHKASNTMPTR